MSLMNCPECRHEVSSEAVACPNCGRPLSAPTPVITRRVVVAEPADDGFPTWIVAPIVALAALVIFLLIALTRGGGDEAANTRTVNVNLDRREAARESTRSEIPSRVETVPAPAPPASYPSTSVPSEPSRSTSVPPSAAANPPSRGTVEIDARVAAASGEIKPVRSEKFYLLDKELEQILDEAGLESIEANTLSDSLGLAVMNPGRYGAFRAQALAAINKHVKYSATTGSDGRASIRAVEPDSYYLFGVTKTPDGYAVWSSPVTVAAGDNKLNLQPARVTAGE